MLLEKERQPLDSPAGKTISAPLMGQGATQLHAAIYRTLRGQGATEYLIVLGVVLVIGLVSVALLGSMPSAGAGVSDESSKAYWQGVARPMRVPEAVYGEDRELRMVVENADPDPLSLQSLQFDGGEAEFFEGNETNQSDVYLSSGEKKTLRVALPEYYCEQYGPVQAQLSLNYLSVHGTPSTQKGEKPLTIECTISTLMGRDGNGTGGNQSQNQTQNQTQNETLNTTLSACGITLNQSGTYTLANSVVASGNCFTITGNDVTLNCGGNTMTGGGSGDGVSIQAERASVQGCVMSGFARGIYSNNHAGLSISSNSIETPSSGYAIYLTGNLTGSSISSNTVTGTGVGLYISGSGAGSTGVSVSGNNVNTVTTGIYAANYIVSLGSGSSISSNQITVITSSSSCSAYALYTYGISGGSITGNTVRNSASSNGCGGYDGGNTQTTISGNTYITNTNCVGFYQPGGCINCQITGNNFRGEPGLGAQMSGTYTGTTISGNTFRGNNICALTFWYGISGATFTGNQFVHYNTDTYGGNALCSYSNGANTNNLFTGNTFTTDATSDYVIKMNAQSSNNTFYQNTLYGNKWVMNDNAGNVFSTSSAGNTYYKRDGTPASSFLNMTDDNGDGWADSGSSVPFSSATIPSYWSGVGSDAHPHVG